VCDDHVAVIVSDNRGVAVLPPKDTHLRIASPLCDCEQPVETE
jgi:hypothetical protein